MFWTPISITSPYFSQTLHLLWPCDSSHTHTTKPQPPLRPSLFPYQAADHGWRKFPSLAEWHPILPWSSVSDGLPQGSGGHPLTISIFFPHKCSLKPCPFPSGSFLTSLFSILSRSSSLENSKASSKPSPTSHSTTDNLIYMSFSSPLSSPKLFHAPTFLCLWALSSQASLGTICFLQFSMFNSSLSR